MLWNSRRFDGKKCSTRKAAEISAAVAALENIKIEGTPEVGKTTIKTQQNPTWILVDYENLNCRELVTRYTFSPPVQLIYFVSKCHQDYSNSNFFENAPCSSAYFVDSCIKDASDVAMVYYTCQLLNSTIGIEAKIILLTRDHFAGALKNIINSDNSLVNRPEIIHISSVKELVEYLER
jgi:hypothetical protein